MSSSLALEQPRRSWPTLKRSWTLVLSVGIHVALVAAVVIGGQKPPPRRPTSVAVVASKPKPKPEEKREDPKPTPPPPPVVVKPRAVEVPVPAAPPPVAPPAAAPRVVTGLTMSNGPSSGSSSGIAVGPTGSGPGVASADAPRGDDKQSRTPPAPKHDDPCDAPDTKPRPTGVTQVEYPDKARADGVEGRIQVKIHIGADGAVTDVEIVESIEPSLDAVVLSTLRTWKFQPATHCGKPTAGLLAWAQRFELGD